MKALTRSSYAPVINSYHSHITFYCIGLFVSLVFIPKILVVILLIVCHTIFMMLLRGFGIGIFLYCQHLSA